LSGQYPSGVIDWGNGEWEIGAPYGKFGTFTLALQDPKAKHAEFYFPVPYVFAGLDVYNGGGTAVTITIRSPEVRDVSFTIKPKELRRLKTEWRDASSQVSFDIVNGEDLRFDNLSYNIFTVEFTRLGQRQRLPTFANESFAAFPNQFARHSGG
jgi:hypothetical protein